MPDPELRSHLLGAGAGEADMAGLDDTGLVGLAGDLRLAAGLDMTLAELSERCATTSVEAQQVYRALGLDATTLAGFGDGDVELLRLVLGDEVAIISEVADELLRVAGRSLRQLAEATVAAYVQDVENDPHRPERDLVGLAEMNAYASSLLVAFSRTLGTVFRHHMWVAVRNQRRGQQGVGTPALIRAGVGFVDLVGFTSMARAMPPDQLMALIEAFELQAFEVAAQHGGRVVKSIGDEVMITGPDHETVASMAKALVRDVTKVRGSLPRVGLSAGEVIFRLGDYFGPVVNTAARLADAAGPGEILTDIGKSASDDLALHPAGRRQLKGFDTPIEVWSVG